METTEHIESLNRQLKEEFGCDTITGIQIYRIVWSDDQFEKRMVGYTDSGIQLLTPEVRLMPKYKQWIQHKYILERLSVIGVDMPELTINKVSYEPIWTFMDNQFNALPPRWDVCKLVIDTLHAALSEDGSMAKYTEDINPEEESARLDAIQQELFGNETEVGDALAYGEGVVVPQNYEKVKH